MICMWVALICLDWAQGRSLISSNILVQNKQGRSLLQLADANCSKGSNKILSEFPSFVSLRNPYDREEPNVNTYCGGVLISEDRLITSAGCIFSNVAKGIPFRLDSDNLVNRTIDTEFLAAVAPYCRHGDGAEIVKILGYHFLEESYTGFPKEGNAIAVLVLNQNVTSVADEQIPSLRTAPLPNNTTITMVGQGAATNEEHKFQDQTQSRPPKIIQYVTISDQECQRRLNDLLEDKIMDEATESCAVVLQEDEAIGICNSDDGNPLYDSEGYIVGVVTWWPQALCETPKDRSRPIVFADVTKVTVNQFIDSSETETLYFPPTITDGCGDGQILEDAPWSVSIQIERQFRLNNPSNYHHICGGVLIDNGTKILTVASCFWDDFFPLPISSAMSQKIVTTEFDLRQPSKNQTHTGKFGIPIYASFAPRCRHFNSNQNRSTLDEYFIHSKYDGNPRNGNNIAIVTLTQQVSENLSFPGFLEDLKKLENPSEADFSDVMFYSWGAEFIEESREDERGFFNNYFPAKEVEMKLVSEENCQRGILLDDPNRGYDWATELCVDFQNADNFTGICTFDNGGPLTGRYKNTNQLILLGLKSQLQDRQCLDEPGKYEVFTDVIENRNFILDILEPKILDEILDKKDSSETQMIIIISVVGGSVLIILTIVFIVWRKIACMRKKLWKKLQNSSAQYQIEGDHLNLSQDVSNIHQILGIIARNSQICLKGKLRRHSNLPASVDFLFSDEKIKTQIAGYIVDSADDLYLKGIKGIMPTSPYLLSAMQQQQFQEHLQSGNSSKNLQKSIQRILLQDEYQYFEEGFGQKRFLNSSLNKQLILPETPAREDFDTMINFEKELEIRERLGTGAFGSVFRAFWITRNMEVAVKLFHEHVLEHLMDNQNRGGKFLNSIITELSLLSKIDNPHIVKCFGGCLAPPKICLVLEYLPNGSLDKFIHKYHGDIPIALVLRVAQGIAEGLDALHPTIVHRDLKPQNVLLDENFQVKLVDFGLSKMKEDTYLSETQVRGTPAYTAPEVFENEVVDEKCDIYGLGLIIWEMVSKQRPWKQLDLPFQIMARVAHLQERPDVPSSCPEGIKKLIERCWLPNPKERPSAREVVQRIQILRRGNQSAINLDQQFGSQMQSFYDQNFPVQKSGSFALSINYSGFSLQSTMSQAQG